MKSRIAIGFTALAAATVTTAAALQAQPGGHSVTANLLAGSDTVGPSLSATVAPSWQTNDTVWALAVAGGVVYVGGSFTSVRPPGDPAGTGEVARSYLAAFDASTGGLLSFDPILDGQVTALAVSPDGSTLYAGGSFTHVDVNSTSYYRPFLAAFNTATGALSTTWKPQATGSVLTIAPSPTGSEIYIGGNFSKLDGVARNRAGAVDASGALLPWAPSVNGSLTSIAVAPDDSRVIVGGYFTVINGVTQQAIGSTNPTTGAGEQWLATILPHTSTCVSDVKEIIVNGTTAYIAAEGTGGGCFDGDFAANISNGALIWQNDCLGATQSIAIVDGWLYKGSHAHDCAYAPQGFQQVDTSSGTHPSYHLLNQSLADGSLGHWTPNTDAHNLGPRVMATDGSQLFLGGDFTEVNGKIQQGFARFPASPDATSPWRPGAPVVTSTSAGVDSVSFSAVTDRDSGTLTYSIYRDGGTTPIGTVTATSWPWAHPLLHYRDAGLTAGTQHTYQVSASDGVRTSAKSAASAPVTVSSTSPSATYRRTVLDSKPSFYWRLDETSGTTAGDSSPNGFNGIYEPGTTLGVPGAIAGSTDTAVGLDGRSGLVTSVGKMNNPEAFTIECWFKSTTKTGGKLIGFGNHQTGLSASADRHIYMLNDGHLVFGVYPGQIETIESASTYNDGRWHYVVATLSPTAGMALYVDGRLVGTNPTTSAQDYSGYWRVGGDRLGGGWNLDPRVNSQGLTEPNSFYFPGSVDEVAVYPYVFGAWRVAAHYAANALSH